MDCWGSPGESGGSESKFVRGQNRPEESGDMMTCEGHVIPLGRIVKDKEDGKWYRPDYSEYIVASQENIMVRYIIKAGRADKKYSGRDLYMNEAEDDPMIGTKGREMDSDSSGESSG